MFIPCSQVHSGLLIYVLLMIGVLGSNGFERGSPVSRFTRLYVDWMALEIDSTGKPNHVHSCWSSLIIKAVCHDLSGHWYFLTLWNNFSRLRACYVQLLQLRDDATSWFQQGLVNVPFWGFVSHHLQPYLLDTVSPIVGWCETLGHQSQPLFNAISKNSSARRIPGWPEVRIVAGSDSVARLQCTVGRFPGPQIFQYLLSTKHQIWHVLTPVWLWLVCVFETCLCVQS